jgi:hypothetical protein
MSFRVLDYFFLVAHAAEPQQSVLALVSQELQPALESQDLD